jgi:hypothetical protein
VGEKLTKRCARWSFGGFAIGAVLVLAAPVQASPTYPGVLKDDLKSLTGRDMPCTPPCTICHRDSNGGRGTVVKPFGLSMMNNGLAYRDEPSLARALAALKAQATDSDHDGSIDVDEISLGHDPNVPGDGQLCVAGPRYGCGASVARSGPSGGSWLVGAAALLCAMTALMVRRRALR